MGIFNDDGFLFPNFDKAGTFRLALQTAITMRSLRKKEAGNLAALRLNEECGDENAPIARAMVAEGFNLSEAEVAGLRSDIAYISELRRDGKPGVMAAAQAILKDKCVQLGIRLG